MEGIYVMQERERLEAKLIQIDAERAAWKRWCEAGEAALGEALARAERAEAERDAALLDRDRAVVCFNRRTLKLHRAIQRKEAALRERDDALALVETLRGAIEQEGHAASPLLSSCGKGCPICEALSVAPPQALAQQRGRMERLATCLRTYAVNDWCTRNDGGECQDGSCLNCRSNKALAEFDAERGQG